VAETAYQQDILDDIKRIQDELARLQNVVAREGISTGAVVVPEATVATKGKLQFGGDFSAISTATIPRIDKAIGHFKIKGHRPWIDVTHPDYGADPTGTTNSTTAFNNAIIAANAAGGGWVLVPPGTYVFNTQISMRSNVTLVGFGRPVLKPSATMKAGTDRLLSINVYTTGGTWVNYQAGTETYGQANIGLEGLVFDGDGWYNGTNALVPLWSIDGLSISDCEFRNYDGASVVFIGGCRNITIRRIKVHDYGWGTVTAGAGGLAFWENQVVTTRTGTVRSGPLSGNSIDSITTGTPGTINKTAHGMSVGDGVKFDATSAPAGITLLRPYYIVAATADTFQVALQPGGAAIAITSAGTDVTVHNNQLIGTGTAFVTEMPVGSYVQTGNGQTRKVTTVGSNTGLRCHTYSPWDPIPAGTVIRTVDSTPCNNVLVSGAHIYNAAWHGMMGGCRNFLWENIVIEDVGEAGVYSVAYNLRGRSEPSEAAELRDGIVNGMVVDGVKLWYIQSAAWEGSGRNVAVRNFVFRNCEGEGIQVNWPAEHVTYEDGHIYGCLDRPRITAATWSGGTATFTTDRPHHFQGGAFSTKVSVEGSDQTGYNVTDALVTGVPSATQFQVAIASDPGTFVQNNVTTAVFWAWDNYGQTQLLTTTWELMSAGYGGWPTAEADTGMNDITFRNVTIGHRTVTPDTKWAFRAQGQSGQFMYNVRLDNLHTQHGWNAGMSGAKWQGATPSPFAFSPTNVAFSAEPLQAGSDVRRIYSVDRDVELSAYTTKNGGIAGLKLRANSGDGSAAYIGGVQLSGAVPHFLVGTDSDITVTFMRGGVGVASLNVNKHFQLLSGRRLGFNLDPQALIHLPGGGAVTDGIYFGLDASQIAFYREGANALGINNASLRVGGKITPADGVDPRGAISTAPRIQDAHVANVTTSGNNITAVANSVYLVQIILPFNVSLNGIAYNTGSVVAGGNVRVMLYDSAGNLLVERSQASPVATNENKMVERPFASPFAAKGPGLLFVGLQFDNATDRFRSWPGATDLLGYRPLSVERTQASYAAPATIAVPTTHVEDQAPIVYLY
jgi:hypothetical protein